MLSSADSADCGLATMTLKFSSWQGQRLFAFSQCSHRLWGQGQPSFLSSGKAERGSEANHSPLSNAKLRMHGAVPPHYASSHPPPAYVLPLMSERKLHSRSKRWVRFKFCIF